MNSLLRAVALALLLSVVALVGSACADSKETPAAVPAVATEVFAVINQPSGVVRIRLATKEAPRLSMSFINLVERGYFNGRPWTDFSPVVRQLGDSIPLFSVPHEYSPKLMFDIGGRLCASNTTEDKNGRAKPNRIFITVKEQDRWNLVYCVFGVVVEGLEVMRNLSEGETVTDIRIEGDSSALRKRFAKELVDWDAAIDAANVGSVR